MAKTNPADSIYILKIVFYLVLGSIWLKILPSGGGQIPLPVGALAGVLLVSHDRFRIDRRIEYAVLLLAMFIGFWLPIGLELSL